MATAKKRKTARRGESEVPTKDRIVAAAVGEFAKSGLNGARIDEIAKAAGVNKQLLYHHLGDKEDLYLVALEKVYGDFRSKEQGLDLEQLPPWAALERFVTFKFDYLSRHPEYVALLMDENLHRGRHVKRSRVLAKMHANLVDKLADVLTRGVRHGDFRPGLDPLQVYISLAALCYFYFGNIHTLSSVLRTKLAGPEALADRLAHILDFVRASVRAASTAEESTTSRLDAREPLPASSN